MSYITYVSNVLVNNDVSDFKKSHLFQVKMLVNIFFS